MKEVLKKVKEKHKKNIWTGFSCLFLGFYLLFTSFILDYQSLAFAFSDRITAIFVIILSILALRVNKIGFASLWLITIAGLYLNFAPLIYPAKNLDQYLNDTMIGVLLVIFSSIIPGLPGKVEEVGHEIPLGWSYNPSSWYKRMVVLKFGILALFISRYLASYQLGYISSVWDPIFAEGTKDVLTSSVSRFFPISDAGLGCFAYTVEVLLCLKGGKNRWRTMPWMVISFLFLVVPLGIVSIVLVLLQPFIVGKWCFLCLATAVCMLFMIVFAVGELVAVIEFLHQSKKCGNGFWKTFFHGGDIFGTKDEDNCSFIEMSAKDIKKKIFEGVGFPITLILTTLFGVLLMITPYLFSFENKMAGVDHLIGPLIIVISVLSFAEVIRFFRFINLALAAALMFSSWILSDMGPYHSFIALFVILLSLKRGKIKQTYGPYQKIIR